MIIPIEVVFRGKFQHYTLRYTAPNTIKGAAVGYEFIPQGYVRLSEFPLVRKFRTWSDIRSAMLDAYTAPLYAKDWNGNNFNPTGHDFECFIIDGFDETDPDFLKII